MLLHQPLVHIQYLMGHTVLATHLIHTIHQEQKPEQFQELIQTVNRSHIQNPLLAARKLISCRGLHGPPLRLILDMNQEQQCSKIQAVPDFVCTSQDVEQLI